MVAGTAYTPLVPRSVTAAPNKGVRRLPQVKLREADIDDFEAVMRLYRQLQPADPVLEDGKDLSVFKEILASDMLKLFVLEKDGVICSSIYLNVIPNITRSASPYSVIENVVTDEEERGKGYGKTLMQYVLSYAWSIGCYKAMLLTGSSKEATHAYYQSCGFVGSVKTGYIAKPS